MFLIEYDNGLFVNANDINWVGITASDSRFTLKGDVQSVFTIGKDHCKTFFNHLQALNDNITNIESCWHKLNT